MTTNKTHGRFFSLLKQTPGYVSKYREEMKKALVEHYSDNKTTSLSEMYIKYPDAYERMIYNMKKERMVSPQAKRVYDPESDMWRKRVIAAICAWIERNDIRVADKVGYAITMACRASNCSDFNRIPQIRLAEIYNAFLKKSSARNQALLEQEVELMQQIDSAILDIKNKLKIQ